MSFEAPTRAEMIAFLDQDIQRWKGLLSALSCEIILDRVTGRYRLAMLRAIAAELRKLEGN